MVQERLYRIAKKLDREFEHVAGRLGISGSNNYDDRPRPSPSWWFKKWLDHFGVQSWIRAYVLYVLWTIMIYYAASTVFYVLICSRITDQNFGVAGIVFACIGAVLFALYIMPCYLVTFVYQISDHAVMRNIRDLARIRFGFVVLYAGMTALQILNVYQHGFVQDVSDDGTPASLAAVNFGLMLAAGSGIGMIIAYNGSMAYIRVRDRIVMVKYIHQKTSGRSIFGHIQEPKRR